MRSFHTRYVMLNSRWFLEKTTKDEGAFHSLKEIIYTGRSQFQRIDILMTGSYGKCLVLDGKMQSSEVDEFIYHEALVHPALFLLESPQKILIAGGGEGATAREALKHPTVSEVIIVDLDRELVNLSKKYLDEWHRGAFEDRRVKIFFEDARSFIQKAEKFDAVIIDLPEPVEDGPAAMLYTKEFYEGVYKCLSESGIAVTQATSVAVNNLKAFTAITNTIKQVFPVVKPYTVNVPSFFSPWGFVLMSKNKDLPNMASGHLQAGLDNLKDSLRFYDYETHAGMFSLPRYLRDSIAREELVITDSSPISFY